MTASGEPIKIKIKRIPIGKWNSFEFVTYFYNKADALYGRENVERDLDKDCMIVKRWITDFSKNNMSKSVVKSFIEWGIKKYTTNNKFVIPVTLGWINMCRDEYLKKPTRTRAKRKRVRDVKPFSEEKNQWIQDEIKRYKKPPRGRRKRNDIK